MAQPFFFLVGSLDLADFFRAAADEGWDPFDSDMVEPQFSQSPLRDGAVHIQDVVGPREQVWPLALNRANKPSLIALEQQINRELAKPDVQVEWRDVGASQSTFYDLIRGRAEPDANYRRGVRNWQNLTLRLWTDPYGHTGTERLLATGIASSVLLEVAVPSIVQGDVPALLDVRITAGDTVPSIGRRVAFAVLPHASYAADFPAASIGDRQAGATLVGLAGADGSQYLGLPVSPTCASGIAAMVPLQIPTVYAGRNRVFVLAKSRLTVGVNLRVFDPFGNPLGPTMVATAQENWGLLDAGVLNVPAGRVPTTFKLPIIGGGASGNGVVGSPGLHLNAVFVLPEDETVVVNDVGGVATTLAGDDFSGAGGALTGVVDDYGNTWRQARSQASIGLLWGNGAALANTPVGSNSGNYLDIAVQDCDTVVNFYQQLVGASGAKVTARRDVNASYYVDAAYQHVPSKQLSLISVASGATTLHASQAVASLALFDEHYLALRTLGGQGFVNLRRADGATVFLAGPTGVTVASVGASHANLQQAGNPGVGITDALANIRVGDIAVRSVPSSGLAARDIYRFSVDGNITRNPSGFDITAYLGGQARGRVPGAPAPTTARIAALIAPVDQGDANGLLSVEVRAKERFRFNR